MTALCWELRPDATAHNTLINGQSRALGWARALLGAAVLRAQFLQPSTVTWTEGLTACSGCREWGQALSVLKQLSCVLQVDVIMHSATLSAMTDAWQVAIHIAFHMLLQHLQVDIVARNALLNTARGTPNAKWRAVADQLLQLQNVGLRQTKVTVKVATSGLAESRQWRFAVQALVMCRHKSLQDDLAIHGAAVHACRACWGRSLQLLQRLCSCLIEASTIIVGAAMAACGTDQRWVQSSQMLSNLQSSAIQVSTAAQNAVLGSCRQAPSWKFALASWESTKCGLELDTISSGAVLQACVAEWRAAMQHLDVSCRRTLQTGP